MKSLASFSAASLAILACFLWSTAFVAIKVGLRYATPLSFAGLRFTLAGLLLIPFSGGFNAYVNIFQERWKLVLLVGFLQTTLLYGLFNIGMTIVSGATGAVIIGASPLFAAVIAHYFMPDDKMTAAKIMSIALGVVGVVIISSGKQPGNFSNLKEILGISLLIGNCIISAFGDIIIAKEKQKIAPILLNSCQMLVGGLLLLAFSVLVEGLPKISQPPVFYLALCWLATLSAIAISLWFILLQRPQIKVSELNIWKFIVPVSGAILSWLILPNETPTLITLLGMSFVAMAILLMYKNA